jgi:hypothetical protein
VQEFVKEETKNLREFFRARAPWAWTLAMGDLDVPELEAKNYMADPDDNMIVLGLLPSGRSIGWKNTAGDEDWSLNQYTGDVRLIAPNEAYYRSPYIGYFWSFCKWHPEGFHDGSSVSNIPRISIMNEKEEPLKAASLAQLVSVYKEVYQAENKEQMEDKLIIKMRKPFTDEDVDELVGKQSPELMHASFFLLGKGVNEGEAETLIRLGCEQARTEGDDELWNLLDKPVRDLRGFSFPEPDPDVGKGAYYATNQRIYARDRGTGRFDYLLILALFGISLVVGLNQETDWWERVMDTFNLLFTGLVAVVLFLASEKDQNGERPLVNRLMLRRAISKVNKVDELQRICSVLKEQREPWNFVSWPELQLAMDSGGKTILDFDKVRLRDLGVDEVTICSQSMFVTVLKKNFALKQSTDISAWDRVWYLDEEVLPEMAKLLLKGADVILQSKPS